jgi:hypothetical protein
MDHHLSEKPAIRPLAEDIDPFESLGERIGLLATVEAADLKRTHSFGKLIMAAWSVRVGC